MQIKNIKMDCIPYIDDLILEIKMLKDIKINGCNDVEAIKDQIKQKENVVNNCKENLEKLSAYNIEYKLYLNILSGMTPTQSVEKVANDNYKSNIKPSSVASIWNCYKKMKKVAKL